LIFYYNFSIQLIQQDYDTLFLLVCPEGIAFGADVYFAGIYFFFSHKISELRQPIAVKFCSMMGSVFSSIIPDQNFEGPPWKKFKNQKHAKFGPILDDFKLRWRISPEWIYNIFKIGQMYNLQQFLPHSGKKLGKLWSTNHWDLDVETYLPKLTFSGDHISTTPKECWATHATEWPSLTSAPPNGNRSPSYDFFSKGVQNWIKI